MEEKKRRRKKIIKVFIYILFLVLIYFSLFIKEEFNDVSFEQLIYNTTNVQGANFEIVLKGFIFVFARIIITLLILYLLYRIYKYLKIKIFLNIRLKNKKVRLEFLKKTKLKSCIIMILFICFSLYYSTKTLNIHSYIIGQFNASELFENYYVDGKNVELKFPEEKRNLIYIYVESLETTNVSIENGGLVEESYIPNLEKLALDNINFSNTDKLGGAVQVSNTGWTTAALMAHTAGVPLKLSIDGNTYQNYGDSLPGVYNLGDILSDNGYNNYFMIGSRADYGGRKDYFDYHGDYTIYDYLYAIESGLIEEDYIVWWGYEDQKLFEFSKDKILEAAAKDEPFNFTLLTVDTHFTDGYMDDSCEEYFDSKYANSFYCSDTKIMKFIKWLKKQDFYENTTIIISGDHLTMQSGFYEENDVYQRTIYNTFINSAIEPENEKNRLFSSFDMFPTTLASLGVEIEGNKLGLGVNLFSNEKTLIEELGYEQFNDELSRKSFYYDNEILGDTYYKMQEEK